MRSASDTPDPASLNAGRPTAKAPTETLAEAHAGTPPGELKYPSPAAIFALAVTIGIVAGYMDLIALVAKRNTVAVKFYWLSHHMGWMIPLGTLLYVLLPAAILIVLALARPRLVTWFGALTILGFVGLLDVVLRLPIRAVACTILAMGMALQAARILAPRFRIRQRGLNRIAAALALSVIGLASVQIARDVWVEHQANASLPPARADSPNVVLIVLDSVRAKQLSLYGNERPTTPNLDRWADRGVVFQDAIAPGSWTLPSHASMFTGRWVHELPDFDVATPLDDKYPTLAEYLTAHGFDTAGFVANHSFCHWESGIPRGFTHYNDYRITLIEVLTEPGIGFALAEAGLRNIPSQLMKLIYYHTKDGIEINREFLSWLDWQEERNRPFFVFLNYFDAHEPFLQPRGLEFPPFGRHPESDEEYITLLTWNRLEDPGLRQAYKDLALDSYDDAILALDAQLDLLFKELEIRGELDNTLVVVTGDHGEHFGEHNAFHHGFTVYRQEVHVPLLVFGTKALAEGRKVEPTVSLRNIAPTIVELVGLDAEASPFPGASFAGAMLPDRSDHGANRFAAEPALSQTGRNQLIRSIVLHGFHLIQDEKKPIELYDMKNDPEEVHNLANAPDMAPLAEQYMQMLEAMVRGEPLPARADEEEATPRQASSTEQLSRPTEDLDGRGRAGDDTEGG